MVIRKATLKDIPAIRSIAEVAFPDTYKSILTKEQIDYMMDMMYSADSIENQMNEGHAFFICDSVGYVSFRPDGQTSDGTKRFHLEKLYVVPEKHGTGLGRILFQTVMDAAKESAGGEKVRIELNVNRYNKALSFYEHIGMVRDRQGDFPIGNGYYMNDYIMAIEY